MMCFLIGFPNIIITNNNATHFVFVLYVVDMHKKWGSRFVCLLLFTSFVYQVFVTSCFVLVSEHWTVLHDISSHSDEDKGTMVCSSLLHTNEYHGTRIVCYTWINCLDFYQNFFLDNWVSVWHLKHALPQIWYLLLNVRR